MDAACDGVTLDWRVLNHAQECSLDFNRAGKGS